MNKSQSAEIEQATATGEDIARITDVIQEVLKDEEIPNVIMGCLVLTFLFQRPDIKAEQLFRGVEDVSQWIVLYLSGLDDLDSTGKVPKELLN